MHKDKKNTHTQKKKKQNEQTIQGRNIDPPFMKYIQNLQEKKGNRKQIPKQLHLFRNQKKRDENNTAILLIHMLYMNCSLKKVGHHHQAASIPGGMQFNHNSICITSPWWSQQLPPIPIRSGLLREPSSKFNPHHWIDSSHMGRHCLQILFNQTQTPSSPKSQGKTDKILSKQTSPVHLVLQDTFTWPSVLEDPHSSFHKMIQIIVRTKRDDRSTALSPSSKPPTHSLAPKKSLYRGEPDSNPPPTYDIAKEPPANASMDRAFLALLIWSILLVFSWSGLSLRFELPIPQARGGIDAEIMASPQYKVHNLNTELKAQIPTHSWWCTVCQSIKCDFM